jgi:preprotein translocase subunit YajC
MAAMQMPIMMLLIFGVFWLLIIRPQAKKQKEHQQMLNKLGKGAVVITRGGIIGTITGVQPGEIVVLEIQEKVRVRVPRAYMTRTPGRPSPMTRTRATRTTRTRGESKAAEFSLRSGRARPVDRSSRSAL